MRVRLGRTGVNIRTAGALAAKKYSFGMVYLILLRLEDMEGYHQVHDRQIQKRK